MHPNNPVIKFVLITFTLYFFFSLSYYFIKPEWRPFGNIELLSECMNKNTVRGKNTKDFVQAKTETIVITGNKKFELYLTGRNITDFNTDPNRAALSSLMEKLYRLKKTGKGKVRIAYFGDSMIEGDLLTQTVREYLQREFGGCGVGYVPVTSQVSKFRQTVTSNASSGWEDINFKSNGSNDLFLSGHCFKANASDFVSLTDKTIKDSLRLIEKSLLFGRTENAQSIAVNNAVMQINGSDAFNRQVLLNDATHAVRLSGLGSEIPVYGISFESENGVFVDNFSFRGISGIELAKLDPEMLKAVARNNNYDLVIFQYGVNMLFRPEDKNFNWYAKAFTPVVKKFKSCFPGSEFMMISTADRAFRYNGRYESAHGIDSLIKVQATIAYNNNCSFYNQFESMGGKESIVRWADTIPSMANKDYVHPNFRGAEVLGRYFFESLMKEYNQYSRSIK